MRKIAILGAVCVTALTLPAMAQARVIHQSGASGETILEPLPAETWTNRCPGPGEGTYPLIAENFVYVAQAEPGKLAGQILTWAEGYRLRLLYWPTTGTMAEGRLVELEVGKVAHRPATYSFAVPGTVPAGTYDGSLLAGGDFYGWCHHQIGYATTLNGGAVTVR